MNIAVDIGASNMIIASQDIQGNIIDQVKLLTPETAQDTLELIEAAIASQFNTTKFDRIIIGVPGPVENNLVRWCSNLGKDWKNFDFATRLIKDFNVEVLVENDANLAGLAEVNNLANLPKSAIYLTIGAGIGSSFIINGQLVPGLMNSEAGMTPLEYDGVIREWEKFASSHAIKKAYGSLISEINDPKIWRAITDRLSRGILVLIPIVQPDIIIIGGSMGTNFNKYGQYLKDIIDEKLPIGLYRPSIKAAAQPELAVINGAHIYSKLTKHG